MPLVQGQLNVLVQLERFFFGNFLLQGEHLFYLPIKIELVKNELQIPKWQREWILVQFWPWRANILCFERLEGLR